MKKAMIGILVLIPIIIILVVGLVTTFVSTAAHIAVEEVRLNPANLQLQLKEEVYDLKELINVTILPDKATNHAVTWSIENLEYYDSDYKERREYYLEHKDDANFVGVPVYPAAMLVDENGNEIESGSAGLLKVNSYCTFQLVVAAETKKARCFVYIGGENVEGIYLSTEGDVSTIPVGGILQLNALFAPIDAIVREGEWESSDESVAVVDGNGVVRGVGEGSAQIVMRAKKHTKDEYVESAGYEVIVSGGVSTRYGSEVSVDRTEFTLSELGLTRYGAGEYIGEGCEISGDGTVRMSGAEAKISGPDGKSMRIRQVEAGGIEIENGAVYGYEEGREKNYVLEAGGMPLSLRAVWSSVLASGSPTGAVWRSSNESVAEVDGSGRVRGVGDGIAEISCEANGKRAAIKVAVKEKITALVLEISDGSQEVGIARETVYGAKVYGASGETANGIDINIKIPTTPEGAEEREAFYRTFIFEVSDGEKAYFEGNRLVFVPGAIGEYTELEVTVRARYPKYESMTAYTTAKFKVKVSPGIEVYSYEELKAAAASDNEICLGANIKFEGSEPIKITKDIYGNDRMIYADKNQLSSSTEMMRVVASNVRVSNIMLRANTVEGEITDAEGNLGLTGYCIKFSSDNPVIDRLTGVSLEYSILENAATAIGVHGCDILINGSIIRNTSGAGIYSHTSLDSVTSVQYTILTMRNCVMSNLVGTAMSFQYNGFSHLGEDVAKAAVAAGRNTVFNQEGFLDIYNWQPLDTLNLISPDLIAEEKLAQLLQLLNSVVREEFKKEKFDNFRKIYLGNSYVHMGFISTGLMEPSYLEFKHEDDRFIEADSTMLDIPIINTLPPARIFGYSASVNDITPERTYTVNNKLIDKLHGIM